MEGDPKTGEVTVEYERHGRDPYPYRARTKKGGVWYAGDNLDQAITRSLRAWFEETEEVNNEQ